MVQGQKVDISVLCTLASTSVRISSRLGLERVAKDVTTLEQYLAEREELADRDLVQRLDDLNGKPSSPSSYFWQCCKADFRVSRAAEAIGITRQQAFAWRSKDL